MLVPLALLLAGFVSGQESMENRCFPNDRGPQSPLSFENVEEFGLNIFTQLSSIDPAENLLVSPYSLYSVLNLVYFGTEGNTKVQLESAMGIKGKKSSFSNWKYLEFLLGNPHLDEGTTLLTTNRAFFSEKLQLDSCLSHLLTAIETVDFENTEKTSAHINREISNGTMGKIRDFLSPTALINTRFILVNAVYFKGRWQNQFLPMGTRRQNFFGENGAVSGQVNMMTQLGLFPFASAPSIGASVIALPYWNSSIAMLVFLPDANVSCVDVITRRLNSRNLDLVVKSLKTSVAFLAFPRFKLSNKIGSACKTAMNNLGITDLFDPSKCNLSGFTNTTRLSADAVLHEAVIEVNEEGAEAAAASAILDTRSGPSRQINFVCDRPFVFMIHDLATGVTLFAGILRNPTAIEDAALSPGPTFDGRPVSAAVRPVINRVPVTSSMPAIGSQGQNEFSGNPQTSFSGNVQTGFVGNPQNWNPQTNFAGTSQAGFDGNPQNGDPQTGFSGRPQANFVGTSQTSFAGNSQTGVDSTSQNGPSGIGSSQNGMNGNPQIGAGIMQTSFSSNQQSDSSSGFQPSVSGNSQNGFNGNSQTSFVGQIPAGPINNQQLHLNNQPVPQSPFGQRPNFPLNLLPLPNFGRSADSFADALTTDEDKINQAQENPFDNWQHFFGVK